MPQINPRVSLSMIVKSWVILGTLAMSFYVAFFGTTSFLVSSTPPVPVTHLHCWMVFATADQWP